ncbi:hypothetical protein DL95DRAFT_484334 [Leptodontidium sp. 2 PMI_412]|nr:hypothetical protein DL95DRAFT_484334 [Leptodontidium sp. 2 PMI_412]
MEDRVDGEREGDNDNDGSVGHRSKDEYQKDSRFNNVGFAINKLLKLVFQLSITFSTKEFVNSQSSFSLLVYFSGILGFSLDA